MRVLALLLASCASIASGAEATPTPWAATAHASCEDAVRLFLQSPTAKSAQASTPPNGVDCSSLMIDRNESFNLLLEHVIAGNEAAARYLAMHVPMTDGGHLEDGLIALGQFGDRKVERLMRLARTKALTDISFSDALIMLPQSFVDVRSA